MKFLPLLLIASVALAEDKTGALSGLRPFEMHHLLGAELHPFVGVVFP